ncbi:hypothetical protein WJ83_11395 [Burkholderia ubonensis]|uniref:hypothetical protein n=1 Tax=Burkholderia diffusa TaxID=488732 RepID=UPI00075B40C7|nr:hypothetical protein [Burkholderia diffusa]KVP02348.1 hypothetical protein WJ83_11395 [Burkholderia ubonensis]
MMTSSEVARKHLRLVAGTSRGITECKQHTAEQRGEQLRLPFESEDYVVLMHDAEIPSSDAFIMFIEHYQPKWLVDVRIAPRMDFIAPSRALALKSLSTLRVNYVDVLGRVQNASEWLTFVESLLRSANGAEGPYAFIFDDRSALREARVQLPSMLRELDSARNVCVSTFTKDLIAL